MIRFLVRPHTAEEGKPREFLNGLYWHFPLCCVIAFMFRDGAGSGYEAIHVMHPDRSLKVWVPCWWHNRYPPKGSLRDWRAIPMEWFGWGVPLGAWPGEAA